MASKMYPTRLIGVLVLFVIFAGVRSQSGEDREYIPDSDISEQIDALRQRLNPMSRCADFILRGNRDRFQTQTQSQIIKLLCNHQQFRSFGARRSRTELPPFDIPLIYKPRDVPKVESRCPPGFDYTKVAHSCYKVVYEGHSWTSADQRCRELHPGAHLVAITTKDENIGLKAFLNRDLAKNSHIDVCKLRSSGNPGKMLWSSGRQLNGTSCKEPFVWKLSNNTQLPLSSFTHWYPGEPNCLGNDEPCVHLTPTDDDFLWNDKRCSEMLCPLCEYDLP